MTYRDVMLSLDGHRNRDKKLEGWIRRATLIIGSSMSRELPKRFHKMWPSEDDVKSNVSDGAKALLQKFRENEALKRAKSKVNA